MIILSQDNTGIYDFDNFSCIYTKENIVYVTTYSGELAFILGEYKNEERAKEVVADIFVMMGSSDKYEMPYV